MLLQALEHVRAIAERVAKSHGLEVWDIVSRREAQGQVIRVFIDRPGPAATPEESVSIEDCEQVNREMGTILDVEDLVKAARGEKWAGMPPKTVLGHVHLYVDEIARAEAFYHDALGFDKVVWSYPGALFMSAGGYHHHLGTNTWARGAPAATDADARLLEWEIVVPTEKDADEAGASVRAAGYPARKEGREWLLTDPWGTGLRLIPEDAESRR